MERKEGGWQLIIVSVYVHCKTHRKRSDIEMNETLNLHRHRKKWTADIELDNYGYTINNKHGRYFGCESFKGYNLVSGKWGSQKLNLTSKT